MLTAVLTALDEPPASEPEAYELLERVRWGGAPATCPHCGVDGRCRFLPPRAGVRRTRTGAPTARRVWKCAACGRQFSVLTGTVLAGSRVPLRAWLTALGAWARDGRPSATRLADDCGLTPEAARQLLRRAAAALGDGLATDPLRTLLALPADEAARIRDRTPARKRPRRQVGPSGDYGTG